MLCSKASEIALGCLGTSSHDNHIHELEKLQEEAKSNQRCETASTLGKRQHLENGATKVYERKHK